MTNSVGPTPVDYGADTLDALIRLHRAFGERYIFTRIGPDWQARRTDDLATVLEAPTAAELADLINADLIERRGELDPPDDDAEDCPEVTALEDLGLVRRLWSPPDPEDGDEA